MRRAAAEVIRSARRGYQRRPSFGRGVIAQTRRSRTVPYYAGPVRPHEYASLQVLHSSMYLRSFSVAAFVSMIASSIWYYRQEPSADGKALMNATSIASPQNTNWEAAAPGSQKQSAIPEMPGQLGQGSQAKHLPIANETFYVAELAEEAPLTKATASEGGEARMEKLSPEQATTKLRRLEQSYHVGRGRGVTRFDVVQIPSNNPIEDDHSERIVAIKAAPQLRKSDQTDHDWMFWGVFDGHAGWTTSARLRQSLIPYVARELNATYKTAVKDPAVRVPSPQSIDTAIKQGFVRLDNDLVHTSVKNAMSAQSKRAATEYLAPALSGSCALLSIYDTSTNIFRVACTGDSRAVLGRKGSTGRWTATALSEDQTGGTPSEIARLRAEHPGEPEVTLNGRILGGLEPSRAFGDASYKWTRSLQEEIKKQFFGRSPASRLKSPPYVTAEPIVTSTKIEPENGDFVVLATDGLWEMLTNEEVVGLVGRWIEKQQSNSGQGSGVWAWAKSFAGSTDKSLPVERPLQVKGSEEEGQRAPIRQQQWSVTESDERFVVEDQNVATHLARNALGGRDRDMVCSLLSLVSPYSRRYRDDLTIEVIFFGSSTGATGDVVLNREASNPNLGAKPKL